jgi:hypothetical protein
VDFISLHRVAIRTVMSMLVSQIIHYECFQLTHTKHETESAEQVNRSPLARNDAF